jgi:hypothetical protein
MRELLIRGKNTIDPEVIDPGGRSVEISPVKIDFTFTFLRVPAGLCTDDVWTTNMAGGGVECSVFHQQLKGLGFEDFRTVGYGIV